MNESDDLTTDEDLQSEEIEIGDHECAECLGLIECARVGGVYLCFTCLKKAAEALSAYCIECGACGVDGCCSMRMCRYVDMYLGDYDGLVERLNG